MGLPSENCLQLNYQLLNLCWIFVWAVFTNSFSNSFVQCAIHFISFHFSSAMANIFCSAFRRVSILHNFYLIVCFVLHICTCSMQLNCKIHEFQILCSLPSQQELNECCSHTTHITYNIFNDFYYEYNTRIIKCETYNFNVKYAKQKPHHKHTQRKGERERFVHKYIVLKELTRREKIVILKIVTFIRNIYKIANNKCLTTGEPKSIYYQLFAYNILDCSIYL